MTQEAYSNNKVNKHQKLFNKKENSEENLIVKQHPNKVTNYRKKEKVRTTLFIIALLAFPLIQWAVFWLYPNLKTFALPFLEWDWWEMKYVFPPEEGLFYNFSQQIKSFLEPGANSPHGLLWNAFFNTFHSLWINLIILPIAVIIGYGLAKHVPGEKFFRVIFFTPNIISTVVMCLVFRFMLEGNESLFIGPATKLLQAMGVDYHGWDLENSKQIWTLIYVFCIWNGLSINVVLISSAFQRIPKEIIESSKLDGVTFLQEFFRIEIPLIMPTITTFLINSVIAVTGFYLQPYLLLGSWGGNGKFATIPWLIFNLTQEGDQATYILVATVGIMFSVIIFPLIMLARYIGQKLTPDVEF